MLKVFPLAKFPGRYRYLPVSLYDLQCHFISKEPFLYRSVQDFHSKTSTQKNPTHFETEEDTSFSKSVVFSFSSFCSKDFSNIIAPAIYTFRDRYKSTLYSYLYPKFPTCILRIIRTLPVQQSRTAIVIPLMIIKAFQA